MSYEADLDDLDDDDVERRWLQDDPDDDLEEIPSAPESEDVLDLPRVER